MFSGSLEISTASAFTSNGSVQVKIPSTTLYQTSGSRKTCEPISGARGGSPKIIASSSSGSSVGVGVGVGVGSGVGVVPAATTYVPFEAVPTHQYRDRLLQVQTLR